MQKILKGAVILGLTALVAACGNRAQDDEVVIVEPTVAPEPVFDSKL
ncbi:MAG: hypothetical protein AAF390_01165 [Pseudomonadota bacterium]